MRTGRIIIMFVLFLSFKAQAQQIIGLNVCDQAPELNFWNQDSTEKIALSSLRGKIVLVDFWASWCGPCYFENPYLINTYKTFRNKKFGVANGFEIYSVSLDYNRTNWIEAINHDSLCWHSQVSDLRGWNSQAALTYSINAIPDNFLLDENGIIIGRYFRGYTGKLDSVLNVLSNSQPDSSKLEAPPLTLQIFPNPATTMIDLKISPVGGFETSEVEIYNMMGERVYSQTITSSNLQMTDSVETYYAKGYCTQHQTIQSADYQMDISSLNAGIYLVKIGSGYTKIMKQ